MCADVAAGVNILAGATLGGGTRVNWQASFETPEHVRREWAEQHGLPAIQSERYDRALHAVCTRLGVTTGTPHSLGRLLCLYQRTALTAEKGSIAVGPQPCFKAVSWRKRECSHARHGRFQSS